jgi:predicted Zn finger-like uncharacterized protein
MPINVACPHCGSSLKAPDSAAGRQVKCPKCTQLFAVPAANGGPAPVKAAAPPPARRAAAPPEEDFEEPEPRPRRRREYDEDEEEAPRPRRRETEEAGGGAQFGLGVAALSVGAVGMVFSFIPLCGAFVAIPACAIGFILGLVGLIIGLSKNKQGLGFPIAGSAVSFVGILVALFWWLWFVKAAQETTAVAAGLQKDLIAAMKDVQQQQKKAFGPPPGGPTLLEKNEQLTNADPFDKVRKQSKAKTYTVNLTAGKTYQIDMTSTVIDPYLRLEDPAGKEVAHDDDSGGFPNARIVYPCTQNGEYRVIATTFAAGGTGAPTGPFTLKVQER